MGVADGGYHGYAAYAVVDAHSGVRHGALEGRDAKVWMAGHHFDGREAACCEARDLRLAFDGRYLSGVQVNLCVSLGGQTVHDPTSSSRSSVWNSKLEGISVVNSGIDACAR